MAISHATIAAIIAVYGDRFATEKAAGNGAVFMIYWYIVSFAVTWGPLAWVVSAEVFPLDMRAKGMSISSAVNWIMSGYLVTDKRMGVNYDRLYGGRSYSHHDHQYRLQDVHRLHGILYHRIPLLDIHPPRGMCFPSDTESS